MYIINVNTFLFSAFYIFLLCDFNYLMIDFFKDKCFCILVYLLVTGKKCIEAFGNIQISNYSLNIYSLYNSEI